MRGLRQLALVARRELVERARSKAYLITTAVTVLIVLGAVVAPTFFDGRTEEAAVGTVGADTDLIIETAVGLANANDEPGEGPSLEIETTTYDSRESGVDALLADEIDVLVVEGEELVVKDSASLSGSSLVNRLQRAAATVEIDRLVAAEGEAAANVIELLTSDPLEATTATGEGPQEEGRTLVAYAGLMILYISILLYGTWILTGVTEEKSNRVVEVLLSAARPWQILGGKVLGIGVLAIAQLVLIAVVALVGINATGGIELPDLGIGSLVTLLVWFVLGFALFAILFGAAGSLVSRAEDAQTVALPMSLAAVAGFFASIMTLDDPTGPVAQIGTFFPFTAPFVVPVRAALDAIPPWQYLVSVVIAVVTVIVLTRLAGRIYRGALLKTSKVGVREAWRAAKG